MSTRFDNRDKSTFKKDIKFATTIERYFFTGWVDRVSAHPAISIESWDNNGCGNDGEFIASGNTAGADYNITGNVLYADSKNRVDLYRHPLEVKWVPTAGKFTLKENDLRSYVKEGASILFIYNCRRGGANLRKPKGSYDVDKHIKLLESNSHQFKWGIMWKDKVKELYNYAKGKTLFKPIHYMGGKYGVVLDQKDFSEWFKEEDWS